jgi:antirestriction protein ArdC
LSASAGISPPTIEQSASYLQSWIQVLRGDKRLVVSAAASAQKAADLVLGTTFETAATPVQKIAASQERIDVPEQPENKPVDTAPFQLDLF